MANKHMKWCSTLLRGKKQIKTTMRDQLTPIRMVTNKRIENNVLVRMLTSLIKKKNTHTERKIVLAYIFIVSLHLIQLLNIYLTLTAQDCPKVISFRKFSLLSFFFFRQFNCFVLNFCVPFKILTFKPNLQTIFGNQACDKVIKVKWGKMSAPCSSRDSAPYKMMKRQQSSLSSAREDTVRRQHSEWQEEGPHYEQNLPVPGSRTSHSPKL